jgi:hypothetical protein
MQRPVPAQQLTMTVIHSDERPFNFPTRVVQQPLLDGKHSLWFIVFSALKRGNGSFYPRFMQPGS